MHIGPEGVALPIVLMVINKDPKELFQALVGPL